ncbi:MAG: FCD domain-containing protein [Xylophilus ampelinus]
MPACTRPAAPAARMRTAGETPGTGGRAVEEHAAIHRALADRDPVRAAAATRGHLGAAQDRWIAESAGDGDRADRWARSA